MGGSPPLATHKKALRGRNKIRGVSREDFSEFWCCEMAMDGLVECGVDIIKFDDFHY